MSYFDPIYHSDLSHASELNLSRSTVKRALEDLYQAKLVTKKSRKRDNGGSTSNLYLITARCNH